MAEWLPLRDVARRAHDGRAVGVGVDHAAFLRRVAAWRHAFATQPSSRWAVYLDDTVEFAAALYGAWHAGKAVTLCGDTLPDTVARVLEDVDGLAGDFDDANGARRIAAPAADIEHTGDWDALDEAATRLVVFTSGSTGDATAIHKSLAQLAREVEALQSAFSDVPGDAVVQGTISHQHIYGLLFRVLWPLATGRAIAPRLFFHDQIALALADGECVLVSSPAHLKRIPDTIDWAPARACLRAVFSSGGALPEDAAIAARQQLGVTPTEIYGSSETGGVAWRRWRDDAPSWRALPGVQWRIVDEQLEVSSPHLPTLDWWRSEDRVEADGDDGFRLLGRADRIVKIEERRVSLSALERQLAACDHVREARVIALPGARVQLAAVVVLDDEGLRQLAHDGRRALAQRLGEALAQAHDAVARPRRWRFVERLPMNAQGKVTDAALRALFRPEQPPVQWTLRETAAAELELDIDADLIAFDGHFPQAAILPGVAQLDWAVRFAREAFAMPPRFVRMEALKFQRVIRPGARVHLRLDWSQDKGALTFRYQSDRGPHASGRVLFAP